MLQGVWRRRSRLWDSCRGLDVCELLVVGVLDRAPSVDLVATVEQLHFGRIGRTTTVSAL